VYGEALAILAGDALQARALELVAADIRPPKVAAACAAELARAAGATSLVGGQVDDLAAETAGGGLAELESIHARKTGALLSVSLRLGATVAQASEPQRQALDRYGRALGLAFQIADDLLDVRGDAQALGKRVGKDSDRGKLTFPGLLGAEESARRAEQLLAEAVGALAPLGTAAGGLEALARYVVERDR
jgi:geranylgeranyl diphosphate synthase type II